MAKEKTITGNIVYNDFEGGFWGIETTAGDQFRPINMPEQLKYKGKKVTVDIELLPNTDSFIMWGDPVRIVSFSTMDVD